MIFHNPSGGPELACNECGCRWFDRMTNCCYECGVKVPEDEITAYDTALRIFHAGRGARADSSQQDETANSAQNR